MSLVEIKSKLEEAYNKEDWNLFEDLIDESIQRETLIFLEIYL